MSSGQIGGGANHKWHVQMNKKMPLSPASKMKRYRQRMKENESVYTLYKEKEALRMKQFRLQRKSNESVDLATARKEKARIYMRERRAHIKDPQKKKHILTREGREEQRKYWREKKVKSRAKRSSQKIRRTKEKDAEYRRKKRTSNNSATTNNAATANHNESASVDDDFTTPEAKRKAASRVKSQLPLSAQKFASTVDHLLRNATDNQKNALTDRGIQIGNSLDARLGQCFKECIIRLKHKRKSKDREMKVHLYAVSKKLRKYRLMRRLSQQANIRWSTLMNVSRLPEETVDPTSLFITKPRKIRADAISKVLQKKVEDFFKNPEWSREMPCKKSISKKKLEPVHVMETTLKEAYTGFCKKHTDEKISLSKFAVLRPKSVKLASSITHIVCLCEYCTNIELMVQSINSKLKNAGLNELSFANKYDMVNVTLCQKGEDRAYHRRECLERRCNDCGIKKIQEHLGFFLQTREKDVVSWKLWDYSEMGNGNRRRALLDKTGSLLHLIDELSKALDPFSAHLHQARWQYRQFLDLQVNLPKGWLLMVMDFAQNYTIEYQDEIQSAHWSKPQVTVHPVVTYYNCRNTLCTQENKVIRESVILISSDINHDSHSVHTFVSAVYKYITNDKEVEARHIVQFSDGCGKQYKSITPFVDVSCSVGDFNCSLQRCFFGSRHGKGPCDGEGGVVKCAVSRAVASRQTTVRSATEFYKYCQTNLTKQSTDQECCHSMRKFILIENITRARPNRSSFKTLKGTMKLHEVSSTDGMGKIQTRNLSCFCPVCIAGTTEPCHNKAYVDNQKLVKLNRKTDVLSVHVDQQEETRPSGAEQTPIEQHKNESTTASVVGPQALGSWIAVLYDDVWWPGLIDGTREGRHKIIFMRPAGKNKFYWPEKEEIDFLPFNEILCELQTPPFPISTRYFSFSSEVVALVQTKLHKVLEE